MISFQYPNFAVHRFVETLFGSNIGKAPYYQADWLFALCMSTPMSSLYSFRLCRSRRLNCRSLQRPCDGIRSSVGNSVEILILSCDLFYVPSKRLENYPIENLYKYDEVFVKLGSFTCKIVLQLWLQNLSKVHKSQYECPLTRYSFADLLYKQFLG